jgi:hypothetical protein
MDAAKSEEAAWQLELAAACEEVCNPTETRIGFRAVGKLFVVSAGALPVPVSERRWRPI